MSAGPSFIHRRPAWRTLVAAGIAMLRVVVYAADTPEVAPAPPPLVRPEVTTGTVPRPAEASSQAVPYYRPPPTISPEALVAAPPAEKPSFLSSNYFNVAGPDFASTSTVMQMTQRLQQLLGQYFKWPGESALPIMVQLVPSARAEFSGPFFIRADRLGNRTLFIRWSPETKFEDVAYALGSVGLEMSAVWQRGAAAGLLVPEWMKVAFGKMLEVQIKPAYANTLATQAREFPQLSLRQVMEAPAQTETARAVLAVNAYWLARFLTDNVGKKETAADLFSTLAGGGDPVPVLQQFFPDEFSDPKSLELWWQVGYRGAVDRRIAVVETFAQSRATLDKFEFVTVTRRDEPRRVRLDEAWAERAQPEVRKALQAMLIAATQRQPYVNPVYNNPLKSIRETLYAMINDDEATYKKAWTTYQGDRAQALAIEDSVNAALK